MLSFILASQDTLYIIISIGFIGYTTCYHFYWLQSSLSFVLVAKIMLLFVLVEKFMLLFVLVSDDALQVIICAGCKVLVIVLV